MARSAPSDISRSKNPQKLNKRRKYLLVEFEKESARGAICGFWELYKNDLGGGESENDVLISVFSPCLDCISIPPSRGFLRVKTATSEDDLYVCHANTVDWRLTVKKTLQGFDFLCGISLFSDSESPLGVSMNGPQWSLH